MDGSPDFFIYLLCDLNFPTSLRDSLCLICGMGMLTVLDVCQASRDSQVG